MYVGADEHTGPHCLPFRPGFGSSQSNTSNVSTTCGSGWVDAEWDDAKILHMTRR